MKILKVLGAVLLGFSLIAGAFIYRVYAEELNNERKFNAPLYSYQIIRQNSNPWLRHYKSDFLEITIQNNGQLDWPIDNLSLNSTFFDGTINYQSPFATSEWIDQTIVKPTYPKNVTSIKPRGIVTFQIPIIATTESGIYKQSFVPILNNTQYINGQTIEWIIQVGEKLSYQSTGNEKKIIISLENQQLLAIENHIVIMTTPVSTGASGYATPKGLYKILNHVDVAYSSEYELYMDNWMALSSLKYGFRGYGLHRLPYWKVNPARYEGQEGQVLNGRLYTNGKLYEDYSHLGEKRSHGCIRLDIVASKVLYDWTENGTLVEII